MSIVAIASPAPLTMQPMAPSSWMKVMPVRRASASAKGSSSTSRISASRGWRDRALSSIDILPSSANNLPSPVMMSGLISVKEASLAWKQA